MNNLEQVYLSISSNNNLSEELKENFKELITIFANSFEDVSLDNFSKRISSLQIKRGSKYLIKESTTYKPLENTLYINEAELNKVDSKNSLMMAILSMITSKENYFGFNDNGKLEALNVGLTEVIANFLVGNGVNSDEQ